MRHGSGFGVYGVLGVGLIMAMCGLTACSTDHAVDLSGDWRFALDRDDVGVAQRWYARDIDGSIGLPGSVQAAGLGDTVTLDMGWIGNIREDVLANPKYAPYLRGENPKLPFWLTPETHYVGAAWYQRAVEVPERWRGRRIVLNLERAHWGTTLWVGDQKVGDNLSLSTPHRYDLTGHLTPGTHTLTLRVDNRYLVPVGPNSHSVSDHTQGNWNGVVGDISLQATPPVYVEHVEVYPDVQSKSVKVKAFIGNATGQTLSATLTSSAAAGKHTAGVQLKDNDTTVVEYEVALGDDAEPWDEFNPHLHKLKVTVAAEVDGEPTTHTLTERFGLRQITTAGTRFVLNGRPLFLRGTLECCIFPKTGYPPTDVGSWKRIIRICKAHGLNHIRFHSWCPPTAAFVAADELGFYYQVECASWANQGAALGDGGQPEAWLYDEAKRILAEYGNHPSFVLMAYGNEPGGQNKDRWLGDFVRYHAELDPRRVYTSGAGWPIIPENQYHVPPNPRIQQWGQGLGSRINSRPPETETDYADYINRFDVPVVSHEIGQWCVYPNFDEMKKYTGYLKPRNFELFKRLLEGNHMADQARDLLMASGKLQVLCYKEEIESALRTRGLGGFQLLDLRDFPGQGTALVGVLDPFWDSKPYVTPAQFKRFCNDTVPLARMPKRTWLAGEYLTADIEVAHFGPTDIDDAVVYWQVVGDGGKVLRSGKLPSKALVTGELNKVGPIAADLAGLDTPQELRLVVGVAGTEFENDWRVWVYAPSVETRTPEDVMVVRVLDDRAEAHLRAGGKVLLVPHKSTVVTPAQIGFSPVFWNTLWTGNQPPHTLGILCDPEHPALAKFVTDYHTNWQWSELIRASAALHLDGMPAELRPIVQVIDTWFEARRLGLVVEAKVGEGKLLICAADILDADDMRPVARQMYHSLVGYMASDEFEPAVSVSAEQVGKMFRKPSGLQALGATVTADSEQVGNEARLAIDDNPKTLWHTSWEPATPQPHALTIDLKGPTKVKGLTYLPRQDMPNGRIARYAVYVSNDAQRWGEPLATGDWANDTKLKTVGFDRPVVGRYVKLVCLREVNGQAYASAAEVGVLIGSD